MVWTDVSSILWLSQTRFECENVSSTPFLCFQCKIMAIRAVRLTEIVHLIAKMFHRNIFASQ